MLSRGQRFNAAPQSQTTYSNLLTRLLWSIEIHKDKNKLLCPSYDKQKAITLNKSLSSTVYGLDLKATCDDKLSWEETAVADGQLLPQHPLLVCPTVHRRSTLCLRSMSQLKGRLGSGVDMGVVLSITAQTTIHAFTYTTKTPHASLCYKP